MLIKVPDFVKIQLTKWGLPNKFFPDEIVPERARMNDQDLIKHFDRIWENHLKSALDNSEICPTDTAYQELSQSQQNYFKSDQEHRELRIKIEREQLKFIAQLQHLGHQSYEMTQLWWIKSSDKHPQTIFISFDTVEERQRFADFAQMLGWKDEELGKELLMDFLNKFKAHPYEVRPKLEAHRRKIWDEQLAAMAQDPQIQAEIAAINHDFQGL
ncbi:MAG TPA: hypothetical protein IGS52_15400 [Oscillatoriaceae cyanobacterium M33_DOE_052]|uniref:Uncharacterized protein n=1 Tax=Planktothricoides sp. SpSt-374 TaxID=2282167 RepID=A0A7C3ZI52_9CYAN|nr:hypothetical protein [Oscillatoriaceae cyanobacterium M33_DOE_052]